LTTDAPLAGDEHAGADANTDSLAPTGAVRGAGVVSRTSIEADAATDASTESRDLSGHDGSSGDTMSPGGRGGG
jgi:hypothetical protein